MNDFSQEESLPSSTVSSAKVPEPAPEQETSSQKTADRPHRITILLGLLSPVLALLSLGVSFYVFHDSQRSMKVAQRAYPSFHFDSATISPIKDDPNGFTVDASASLRNIGNTPLYIDSIKTALYAIEADNIWDHISESSTVSPNYDALGPKGDPLVLPYDAKFSHKDFDGDRSVVYRIDVRWHDAFDEPQGPSVFCVMMSNVDLPVQERRVLLAQPCIKGMTFSVGSSSH
ncbi:MAG: hypothetical protein WBE38_02645 [Terracidiphilus sp.]|jgi:hypothetical protein